MEDSNVEEREEEEDVDEREEKREDVITKIKRWALENNISQVALQKLIDILRDLLPQLPLSVKSLLGTKNTFNI